MDKKKVLIITYYWPPGGGAGVQRWLKFVKYLLHFNITPIVYTPENGEMPVIDESLLKDVPEGTEVLRTKIWEPYNIYKKFIGAGKNEKINTGFLTEKKRPGVAEKLSVWVRGNCFIPDARCFWIKPSVKYLSNWLTKNKVDAIISTGPPHSMHMIALEVSKEHNLPWIADFRDPWTNIDYYNDLMLTASSDVKHKQMERDVVTNATRVIVVSGGMKTEFETKYNRSVDLITNGYDEDDIKTGITPSANKFAIAHVGTLVRTRNPEALWKAIADLANTNADFASDLSIRLTGKTDHLVKEYIQQYKLEQYVSYMEYLPHEKVAAEQQSASLLLLILNNTPNAKGILTGKLFEYLAAKRPVLSVGPIDGDAAVIIRESGAGITLDFNDEAGIKNAIHEYYQQHKTGKLDVHSTGVEQFSRKALTEKLTEIINEIC